MEDGTEETQNVLQVPKGIYLEEMPETVDVNVPFKMGEEFYLVEEVGSCELVSCKEEGEKTSKTKKCNKFKTLPIAIKEEREMENMPGAKEIKEHMDEKRVEEFTYKIKVKEGESLFYDFSKTNLSTNDVLRIKKLLTEKDLPGKIEAMWRGDPVNYTENKSVLHYLLRDSGILNALTESAASETDTVSKAKVEIKNELIKIKKFCEKFSNMRGITDKPIKNIVNIGIGGSDLGPRMAIKALERYSSGLRAFFISNVDSTAALQTFREINPEETMFIIVSKKFTTVETISNFKLALTLFKAKAKIQNEAEICDKHFIAVTANLEEVKKYNIKNVFAMWDYVGGRYSLWSAVGLAITLYIGFDNYLELLKGASVIDKEFYEKRLNSVCTAMAVTELFYIQSGYTNKCIACYDEYLGLLYKYLQQAEMESNGKRGSSQMVIWGGVGTDVQHSFFQQLHQGDQKVYAEFILGGWNIYDYKSEYGESEEVRESICKHQKMLVSNCLAQSRALMLGKDDSDSSKVFPGNRPSTTILYSRLTPGTLGAMLAVYEHKIFVHGVFFGINSFDQFGVQLGKDIANELLPLLTDGKEATLDASTARLLKEIKEFHSSS